MKEVFFVQHTALPSELAACAVVQIDDDVVFRLTIGSFVRPSFVVEVAELDLRLLPDPWRVRARGRWTLCPLRGRYVADEDGGREVGPLGELALHEVIGAPLSDTHQAVISEVVDAAMKARPESRRDERETKLPV